MSRLVSSLSLLITSGALLALGAVDSTGPGAPMAPAAPGTPGAPAAGGEPSILPMILMMGGLFAFMYFFLIRPQKKEEKRRKEMIEATKVGDRVATIGGERGVVERVGEDVIEVRLGVGDKTIVVEYAKSAVAANLSGAEAAKKDK
jgi:preprotein translocase subunit YajC